MTSLGRWLWTALDAFWIASIVTLLERGNLSKSRPRGCLGPLSGRRWTSANATAFLATCCMVGSLRYGDVNVRRHTRALTIPTTNARCVTFAVPSVVFAAVAFRAGRPSDARDPVDPSSRRGSSSSLFDVSHFIQLRTSRFTAWRVDRA
jgi:hypothetical protein